MILLDDIVEILALPDGDTGLVSPIVLLNGRRVTATLVNGDLLRAPLSTDGLMEKGLSRCLSRWEISRKSMVWPSLSTARYKYAHCPLIFTYVSSIRQLRPTRRCWPRNALSTSGAYLMIQRLRVA